MNECVCVCVCVHTSIHTYIAHRMASVHEFAQPPVGCKVIIRGFGAPEKEAHIVRVKLQAHCAAGMVASIRCDEHLVERLGPIMCVCVCQCVSVCVSVCV